MQRSKQNTNKINKKTVTKQESFFSKKFNYLFIVCIISFVLFSILFIEVNNGGLDKFDLWVGMLTSHYWDPSLATVMYIITNISSVLALSIMSILLFSYLIYKKRWHHSVLFFLTMLSGLISYLLIKLIIHRLRPINPIIEVSGYSFPSGHSTMSLIFFSLLIYSFKDDIKNLSLKYIFIITSLLLILLIGFSRIYLNVHYFSDVLGGFCLGIFFLSFWIIIFRILSLYHKNSRFKSFLSNTFK